MNFIERLGRRGRPRCSRHRDRRIDDVANSVRIEAGALGGLGLRAISPEDERTRAAASPNPPVLLKPGAAVALIAAPLVTCRLRQCPIGSRPHEQANSLLRRVAPHRHSSPPSRPNPSLEREARPSVACVSRVLRTLPQLIGEAKKRVTRRQCNDGLRYPGGLLALLIPLRCGHPTSVF